MVFPRKTGGSSHVPNQKILMEIESILSVASDLVQEVDRLKCIEEECQLLEKKLFLKQFTPSEQDIFALALDGYSIIKMQEILFKEKTITNQRRSIIQKPPHFITEASHLYFRNEFFLV